MDFGRLLRKCVWYVAIFMVINLSWIGAEYLFEGVVHNSRIDGVICYILSFFILDKFEQLRERSNTNGKK